MVVAILVLAVDSPSFNVRATLLQCMIQHCIQQVSSLCTALPTVPDWSGVLKCRPMQPDAARGNP